MLALCCRSSPNMFVLMFVSNEICVSLSLCHSLEMIETCQRESCFSWKLQFKKGKHTLTKSSAEFCWHVATGEFERKRVLCCCSCLWNFISGFNPRHYFECISHVNISNLEKKKTLFICCNSRKVDEVSSQKYFLSIKNNRIHFDIKNWDVMTCMWNYEYLYIFTLHNIKKWSPTLVKWFISSVLIEKSQLSSSIIAIRQMNLFQSSHMVIIPGLFMAFINVNELPVFSFETIDWRREISFFSYCMTSNPANALFLTKQ